MGRPLCRPVFFTLHFLFPIGNNPTLATPFPSVRTGDCLAAARSRRGSDMPPACHSLPRRRFATLKGAALRGKGLGLAYYNASHHPSAPTRGAVAQRLRGRQGGDWSSAEKKERTTKSLCRGRPLCRPVVSCPVPHNKSEHQIKTTCHSETSDRCHWSWESVSP